MMVVVQPSLALGTEPPALFCHSLCPGPRWPRPGGGSWGSSPELIAILLSRQLLNPREREGGEREPLTNA